MNFVEQQAKQNERGAEELDKKIEKMTEEIEYEMLMKDEKLESLEEQLKYCR